MFPTQDIRGSGSSYALSAGQYEYPFRFKVGVYSSLLRSHVFIPSQIPFNNECLNINSRLTNLNITGVGWEVARDTHRHVKQTLPPSLNGFPGQAEIRYYVKVTVQRPSLFKENFRDHAPFRFFPIEPPRPPKNQRESFARKQHPFAPETEASKNSAGRLNRSSSSSKAVEVKSPTITLDGRLPDPAIATCNEPLPLRVLITKINDSPATLYLRLFDLKLIARTTTRAHELTRTDESLFAIVSKANLKQPLVSSSTAGNSAAPMEIDPSYWKSIPLPNTIAPSFDTCNISRSYTLEIKVGLSWGTDSANLASELAVLSVRMPLKIYSGIAPPSQLLHAMSNPAGQGPSGPALGHPMTSQPILPPRPPAGASHLTHSPSPFTPTGQVPLADTPPFGPSPAPAVGQQTPLDSHRPSPGPHHHPQHDGELDEAPPPSYEDAVADELAPVSGPRRDYAEELLAGQRTGDGSGRVAAQGRNTGAV